MMAEASLQKLEDQLKCPICFDTYTEPKILQCFHTYCQKCLVKLVIRDRQGPLSLICPICRQPTYVPANGVTGLQSAFQVKKLLDILYEHQQAKKSALLDNGSEHQKENCVKHQERDLELFCETCEKLICFQCTITEHHGHNYGLVSEVFGKHKFEIANSARPQLKVVTDALEQVDVRYRMIFDQQNTLRAQIRKDFQQLRAVIHTRETELLKRLSDTTEEKLRDLASQRVQIATIIAQLNSCLEYMENALRNDKEREVLKMKPTLIKEIKGLTTSFQLEPNAEADMIFQVSTDISPICKSYGHFFTLGSPDPSKCHARGKGTQEAVVEEVSTAVLHTKDFENKPYLRYVRPIESELVSSITGMRVPANIERKGQSQYEISYRPTIKGRHQLNIKVEGQHIRGSPFSVTAKLPVENLGTPLLTIDNVMAPCGVAITKGGDVILTEHDRHCVSVFNCSGQKLLSFGTHGSGPGEFKNPRGVAVDGEDNILVVDNNNHRIQKFTAEGQFLASVGNVISRPGDFDYFQSITFNPSNSKVYVINGCRVQILNSDLKCSYTFGKSGSGKGQFDYPWGIACDSTGKVYVADSANHRIQIFTAEGRFLRMFGKRGQERGDLYWPYGIAIDTNDMLYVSEFYNHRISMFNSEGQFVTSFGRFGEKPGEFKYPYALVVDSTGIIYMCDHGNNRAQVF